MRRFYAVGFMALMGFDTLAQISFKYTDLHALPLTMDIAWVWRVLEQPWAYGALVGYVGAFFTWMTLLKRAPIGPAFAASHLEVISIMLCSRWLFGEPVSEARALGALVIFSGIVCLAYAEAKAASALQDSTQ